MKFKILKVKILAAVFLFFCANISLCQQNQTEASFKIMEYKLDNGLTVLLSEDHSKPLVYGGIVVKAGSKNDPAEHTGIAHYLEHMLLKGTEEIGTINYTLEKPYLEKIYLLYDSLGKTKDELKRKDIQKQINEQSLKAGEYAIPTEIDQLLKSIGSTQINTSTTEEMTFFHNAFPPNQIEKWLELYSLRFVNPVFRAFQSEMEVVYEEKNRSMDIFVYPLFETFLKNFYKKHPYGQQSILGTIEHLKNPSLTAMYEFYKNYYVANNMALVICGNFNTEEILPVIKEKFSNWKSGEIPKYPEYIEKPFNGREVVDVKMTPIKLGIIGFRTAPNNNPDKIVIDVCTRMLTNSGGTGLFDKLMLDNKIMAAEDIPLGQNNDYGASVFVFIPKVNGQTLEEAESIVIEQIARLRKGEFSDALLESVKKNIYKEFEISFENFDSRTALFAKAFSQDRYIYDYLEYAKKIRAITKEEVMKIAEKYYNQNYLILFSKTGTIQKQKMEKPEYEPVKPKTDAKSEYALNFEMFPAKAPNISFVNFYEDVKISELSKGITLYYTNNPENDIFSLTLKFGIGKYKMPQLFYAAELMNYAGTNTKTLNETKEAFQKIGCTYTFSCDDDYLIVKLNGIEEDLKTALTMLKDILLNPVVEKNKIKNIIDDEETYRKVENADAPKISKALLQYVRKKDKSSFLNRLSMKEIKALKSDSLLAIFKKGMGYELQIHYVGNKYDFVTAQDIFMNVMKIGTDLKQSESPIVLNDEKYNENTVFFVNKKDAMQSQIYFYVNGENYSIDKEAYIDAFNEYFGGNFSGLVLQEIREYRSLANSTWATYSIPALSEKCSSFIGYVATQTDKTIDAIKVFTELISNMPEKKERIKTIRNLLEQEAFANRPNFRELSENFVSWKLKGFYEDPAKYKLEKYQNLSFDDIMNFYKENIKGKPIVICIVGDEENLNLQDIGKFGKIVKLTEKDLFKK